MMDHIDNVDLLERAARAAGIHDKLLFSRIHDTAYWHDRYRGDWGEHDPDAEWNPLTRDGDAFWLAHALQMEIRFGPCFEIGHYRLGHRCCVTARLNRKDARRLIAVTALEIAALPTEPEPAPITMGELGELAKRIEALLAGGAP